MKKITLGMAAIVASLVLAPVAQADEWAPSTDWVLDHERAVVKDTNQFMDPRTDWVLDHERSVMHDNQSLGE